jgi:uncharacterized membrane protein YGL010W
VKTAVEQLSKYASYHRDPRNIATHFIGIPMIVLAVVLLLSKPSFSLAFGDAFGVAYELAVSPALVAAIVASTYYLKLDFRLGLVMAMFLAACLWISSFTAALGTAAWLSVSLGIFVVGWVFQFVGHFYEGKKPAFIDDVIGLIIGPMFVATEIAFLMGLRKDLQAPIEDKVGPVSRQTAG